MPVRRRLPAPERVHLHLVRRAGTPAEQAGPGASQDEPPRAPGRRWRRPGTRRLPGRARPAIPRPTPTNQPRQDHCKHPPRSHDEQVPFSRRISTVLTNREAGAAGRSEKKREEAGRGGASSAASPTASVPDSLTDDIDTRRTHPDPHPPTNPDRTTTSTPRSHDKQVPFSRRTSTVLTANKYRSREQGGGLTDGVGTWWPRPRSPCRRPLRPAGAPPPSAAAPRPRPRPRPCGRYPGRGPRWCGWRA